MASDGGPPYDVTHGCRNRGVINEPLYRICHPRSKYDGDVVRLLTRPSRQSATVVAQSYWDGGNPFRCRFHWLLRLHPKWIKPCSRKAHIDAWGDARGPE
jgi:hypothetical protein